MAVTVKSARVEPGSRKPPWRTCNTLEPLAKARVDLRVVMAIGCPALSRAWRRSGHRSLENAQSRGRRREGQSAAEVRK